MKSIKRNISSESLCRAPFEYYEIPVGYKSPSQATKYVSRNASFTDILNEHALLTKLCMWLFYYFHNFTVLFSLKTLVISFRNFIL